MRPTLTILLLFLCAGVHAQTNRIVSPEVRPDHSVVFRLLAPKAAEASVFADWMRPGSSNVMVKDADGVWSATIPSVPPGIYIYTFTVDGLTIADPINPSMKLRARTSASLLHVPGESPELWEARDVPHGTVEIQFHRAKSLNNETRQAWVYKPPGYDENTSKRYPLLVLLHGSNDTPAGWTMAGGANYIMDNLLATKNARESIVVMPFGHAVPFDAPRDQQRNNTARFEEYLLHDLLPLIEKKYRIASGRKNHAIVGLSMGGGQALQIGLSHLDTFSAVGAFSSAIPQDFETRFASLLQNPKEANDKIDLLWIGCGRQDGAVQGSERLSKLLEKNGIEHTFRATEGAHTFTVWRQYLSETAPLLFQTR